MTDGRRARYALLGLGTALLVLAVASGWSGTSRPAGGAEDRASVAAAAGAFVRAYGAFDHRRPEGYTKRLAALAAGDLRDALGAASVDPGVVAAGRLSTARVESVRVTSLSGSSAGASVRSRHQRSWTDPATGRAVREAVTQHAALRLVRDGDRWLVAGLALVREEPAAPPPAERAGAAGAR